jgi:hypothetical protein
MQIDFETRKAAAKWARNVSLEDIATPNHDARLGLAKTWLEGINPSVAGQDTALSHVVFLVRTFAGDDADAQAVADAVGQIADLFVAVEAFGAVAGV